MNIHRFLPWAGLLIPLIISACRPAADGTPLVPTPAEGEAPAGQEQEASEGQPLATMAPTATATAEATVTATPAEGEDLPPVQAVRADLARRAEVDPRTVEVTSVEKVRWPDSGLGCPLPGAEYEQKATTGYVMVVAANGERYEYHTDAGMRVVLCDEEGRPVLPTLPARPGDIDDGQPWLPVDPVPIE